MIREIRIFGDPVLREKAVRITEFDDELVHLADNMIETMRAEQGVGLAAQQVGGTDSICVVEVPAEHDVDEEGRQENPALHMPAVLINPAVRQVGEETCKGEEGCLSFPGITAPIERSFRIHLSYQDLGAEQCELELKGFVARVVQHEVDHLNGVLFIDRMTRVKKVALSGRLKRMRRETQQRMGLV